MQPWLSSLRSYSIWLAYITAWLGDNEACSAGLSWFLMLFSRCIWDKSSAMLSLRCSLTCRQIRAKMWKRWWLEIMLLELLSLGMWIKEDSQDESHISMQNMLQVICVPYRAITELLYSLALASSKFIIFWDFNYCADDASTELMVKWSMTSLECLEMVQI